MSKLLELADKKLQHISMMESCGAPVGSQKHNQLINDAMASIFGLLKTCKNVSSGDACQLKEKMKNEAHRGPDSSRDGRGRR